MRIGEVTQENYREFLKLLGLKDTGKLDKVTGQSKEIELDHSFEGNAAAAVASGYAEEGMVGRAGDTSHQKIIPVSDGIKNKFIELVRKQFLKNGNGEYNARDYDEIGALLKEVRKGVPVNDRLSFTYTINQLIREEENRMREYAMAHGWTPGGKIPADVLKSAVSGNFNVKA